MYYFKLLVFTLTLLSFAHLRCCFEAKPQSKSNQRNYLLYNKHGHYLAIHSDGSVDATLNTSSIDVVVQLQSFGVKFKRIRKPGSFYLAMNDEGEVVTRKNPGPDTMFIEHLDDQSWVWYESYTNGYILALTEDYTTRDKLKAKNHTRPKEHKTDTQFLQLDVPWKLRKQLKKN
ncbi:fibroblast growth factor 1-like [Hydractinia symbiolongicarpus]|uniref:fibroblast growth factor 1-like n=1 Tax=Hydractinia symbiolongicarpus TaxID=13093 RepID=UPI00254B0ED9|nr:fibroblast growth factor 1-like [Hydractinia symbiolongicarpus]